jgi:hypothetical protein
MINRSYEKISMPLEASIKFFGWKGKNTITLFQWIVLLMNLELQCFSKDP